MPGRRIKFLLAAIAIAVPLGAWCWIRPPAPDGSRELAATSSAVAVAADLKLEFEPKPGSHYRYRFQRRIVINGLDNKIPPIEFAGELSLHVLEADQYGFTALAGDRVEGQPQTDTYLKVKVSRAGDRLELFSAKPEGEDARQHESVIKDLLSLLIFPLKADTAGEYSARIEMLAPDGDRLRVRKVKLEYLHSRKMRILSSLHLLKWSRALGMPEEIRGREESRLGEGEISSAGTYTLKFLGESKSARSLAGLGKFSSEPLQISASKLSDHPEYAHLNWEDLLARLKSVHGLTSSEQLKLFGDMVRMLEKDPSKVAELAALLKNSAALKQGAHSPLFQQVVGALATNGSPEAQSALLGIYRDPKVPVSGKGSILGAFTTTQAPITPDTRDFLSNEMVSQANKDLAQGAAYALGSALEKAGDSQAEGAIKQILAAWARGGSLQERLALLDVMGNSGRAEFYSVLAGVLQSQGEPELRARGAFSLRYMKNAPAVELLARSLEDPELGVRSGAASGIRLAQWQQAYQQPVERCALSEANQQVRNICLEIQTRRSALASR